MTRRLALITTADQIRELGFGRPGAEWTTDENLQAAQKLFIQGIVEGSTRG